MKRTALLSLILFLNACGRKEEPPKTAEIPTSPAPSEVAYEAVDVSNGGSISGLVKFIGNRPKLAQRPADTKNPEICGHGPRPSEEIILGPGGALRNVVITLEGIKKGKKMASASAVLDQIKCEYTPHVQSVSVGTMLDILNSDDLLHNVHGKYDGEATVFNLAMPLKGQKIPKPLSKPGLISLQCDAGHTWMKGYVVVVDHPYHATTDKTGSFSLTDVPPGTYKVKAWHERLGTKELDVTVNSGAEAKIAFEFAPQ